ncbi:hypothetical protein [Portibacter lacus]|uniref:Transposase IS200-like domain-containing protein n=1 Tax=Portibacter lacus TaxID=1099794 RepID=A0AA37WE53_9BACT|nr:hypothetical protein [Portibacter lacus]GLR18551.1 hypothetical protein GCM10007940_31670 [Portibacter lacus]
MRYQRDIFQEGDYYHLYNKVVGNELLFKPKQDYDRFLSRFRKYMCPYMKGYSYCLMPNHFHFLIRVLEINLVQIESEQTSCSRELINGQVSLNKFLESQLSRMLSGYTLSFNKRYKRMGQLFKQGTKRVLIKSHTRLSQLLCYVHHNPIHHGITNNYRYWQFCSYNAYANEVNTQIAKNEMLEFLGGKEQFFLLHHDYKENYRRN